MGLRYLWRETERREEKAQPWWLCTDALRRGGECVFNCRGEIFVMVEPEKCLQAGGEGSE